MLEKNSQHNELRSRLSIYGPDGAKKQDPFLRKVKHKQREYITRAILPSDSALIKRNNQDVLDKTFQTTSQERFLRNTQIGQNG